MEKLEDLERDRFLEQADTLARLINTPEWAVYEGLVQEFRASSLEEMVSCEEPNDMRFYQGVARAIQVLLHRPHEIVDAAREMHEAEDENKHSISIRRSLELHPGPLVDEV